MTPLKWIMQEAGLDNPHGDIGNRIPPGYIQMPATIEFDNGAIRWQLIGHEAREPIRPHDLILHHFQALLDAKPPDIVKFARKHGVLGLNENAEIPGFYPNLVCGLEPIEKWRTLASRVRSILELAATLETDKDVRPEHIAGYPAPPCRVHKTSLMATFFHSKFSYVCPVPDCSEVMEYRGGPISGGLELEILSVPHGENAKEKYFWRRKPFPADQKMRRRIASECLDSTISEWLFLFPSAMALERTTGGGLELAIDYRFGLLSVIALQLLQVVARRSVYFCAECKNPFIRLGGPKSERRPKSGVNSFCKQCGHRAAVRQAAAKYRAANRARHAAAASHADANQDADAPPELIL